MTFTEEFLDGDTEFIEPDLDEDVEEIDCDPDLPYKPKIPKIPGIKIPKLDFNITKPKITGFDIPKINITKPDIEFPKIDFNITKPNIREIDLPKIPDIDVPKIPKVEIPKLPGVKIPKFPKVEIPKLPGIKQSKVEVFVDGVKKENLSRYNLNKIKDLVKKSKTIDSSNNPESTGKKRQLESEVEIVKEKVDEVLEKIKTGVVLPIKSPKKKRDPCKPKETKKPIEPQKKPEKVKVDTMKVPEFCKTFKTHRFCP